MKDLINKIFSNQSVTSGEITNFIYEYCEVMEAKKPDANEIQAIMQLIQARMFDLNYAIDMYTRKKDLTIYSIYNKNNVLIKKYIP